MKIQPSLLIVGMVALVAPIFLKATTPAPVAVDWFEYTGHDAIPEPAITKTQYRNPLLAGFYPDPSICRVGDDFYLINSTFAYFPGIPIFHSRDLINWQQLGHVITRPEQLSYAKLGVSRGIFAPAISHHDDTFFVICTMVDAGGNFVVTAKNPAGPWSDPTWLPFEGIDPSLFFDEDGRAWIVNNGTPEGTPLYTGHRAIWIQEFDQTTKKMTGPRKVLVNGGVDFAKKPIWIEGPHLYKRNGWYYLSCAEGGTGPQHSQVVLRSRQVDGPYTPWEKNPILTQRNLSPDAPDAVTCTGHADFVQDPDHHWWAVFLGVRPYGKKFSPMGRETFLLPVQWTDDGWPMILPDGRRVPLIGNSPAGVTRQTDREPALNGAITWRDNFSEPALALSWIGLRAPVENCSRLDATAGMLLVTPSTDPLFSSGHPSLVAHRLQHAHFALTTALEVPTEPGVSAGLALFQNETHHYFFAVHRIAEGIEVFVERVNGSAPEKIGSVLLPAAAKIEFQAEGDNAKCSFSFTSDSGPRKVLVENADATLLTSEIAGGFVGATVGLHARMDAKPKTGK